MRYLRSVADPDKDKVPDHALAELAACAQRIRDLEMLLGHATTFMFAQETTLAVVTVEAGLRNRWAVRRFGLTWNRQDRRFELEPPADDPSIERFRFRTRDEAVGIAMELAGV